MGRYNAAPFSLIQNENDPYRRKHLDSHVFNAGILSNIYLKGWGADLIVCPLSFILLSIYRVFLRDSSTQLP